MRQYSINQGLAPQSSRRDVGEREGLRGFSKAQLMENDQQRAVLVIKHEIDIVSLNAIRVCGFVGAVLIQLLAVQYRSQPYPGQAIRSETRKGGRERGRMIQIRWVQSAVPSQNTKSC
jgi:hypothetical protein